MIAAVIMSFLAGVWLGNGIPHFVRGVTKKPYPSALGNSPVPNLIAGWLAIATTPLFLLLVHPAEHPIASWISAMLGMLAIGIFHAGPGAFGKKSW
ncbi:hypothetical protein [Actinomadura rubteroloni]|uniref:hypothetical protein n=1 Tax=Actinomadura rubteroloni TaxID=1926885 RepID=UPI0011B02504|nr:hypothetical protein [Actinomadura rubteroloni]